MDALSIRCPPRTAQALKKVLTLASPLWHIIEDHLGCRCGNYTRAIMLENCGHVVCSKCFESGIMTIPSRDRFPIKCVASACTSLVELTELRKLLSPARLRALFDESAKQYTKLRPEMYLRCRNKKCNLMRPRLDTAEIFTCPECLTQTCAFKDCGREPHPGWDCQARGVWLTHNSACLCGDDS